jgi:FixJ family two-component response regulator
VYVVGRDSELRRLLTQEVMAAGAEAWPFPSGADFLGILDHLHPACVLLDMDDAEIPGLEVLDELAARDVDWPVLAVSAREELQLAIEAMKRGALDFLRLPLGVELLGLALAPAWAKLERSVEAGEMRRTAQERLARLTAREMDVLLALLGGRSNKALAHEFGISVRTVEMHRAHIMAKLEVKSLAEATLLATQSGIDLAVPPPSAAKGRPGAYPGAGYSGAHCREQLSALARRLSG